MNVPPRRWSRWSLRTMFVVVTVLCVWLGWEFNVIRERQAFLTRTRSQGSPVHFADDPLTVVVPGVPKPTIPAWRRWLGDRAVALFGVALGSAGAFVSLTFGHW